MGWGVHSCGTVTLMFFGQFSDICGPVGLMVLGQFSDICGPQISENWPRTANIRKLAQDHKGYGSAARVFSTTFNIILATS